MRATWCDVNAKVVKKWKENRENNFSSSQKIYFLLQDYNLKYTYYMYTTLLLNRTFLVHDGFVSSFVALPQQFRIILIHEKDKNLFRKTAMHQS